MKKIFCCYAPLTGLINRPKSRKVNIKTSRFMIDSALCDLIRINDWMPIVRTRKNSFYDYHRKMDYGVKIGDDLGKVQDNILKMLENLEYPMNISPSEWGGVKDLFERCGFKGAVKRYLILEAIYETSAPTTSLKTMLDRKLNGDEDEISRLYNQYGDERKKFFTNWNIKKNKLIKNIHSENSPVKYIEPPGYYIYRNLLGSYPTACTPKWYSIYEFMIDKGLLTTPSKFNPYTWIKNGKCESGTWRISDLKNFLNHFSLHKIAINDQTNSMKKLMFYLIERITNINLINHIYDINNEEIPEYLCLLGMYPLVETRLKLVDELSKMSNRNPVFYNIMRTIYHQTFVYFPILNLCYLNALFYVTGIESQIDTLLDTENLFCETRPGSGKRRGVVLTPRYEFPDDDIIDKKGDVYQLTTKMTLMSYYESLSFPHKFNLSNAIINNFRQTNQNIISDNLYGCNTLEQDIVSYLKYHRVLKDMLNKIITLIGVY